jgi:hypothetical protein
MEHHFASPHHTASSAFQDPLGQAGQELFLPREDPLHRTECRQIPSTKDGRHGKYLAQDFLQRTRESW